MEHKSLAAVLTRVRCLCSNESMHKRVICMALAAASLFAAPRPSPEFVINYPGNRQVLLSSYRGKVVLLMFILTTCSHCQATCRAVSKLYTEMGPEGFQPLAVAMDPTAMTLVSAFVHDYQINFPVGVSERDPVLDFLQTSVMIRLTMPQVLMIDRKGVIQSQTPPPGDDRMSEENYLRQQIEQLLPKRQLRRAYGR